MSTQEVAPGRDRERRRCVIVASSHGVHVWVCRRTGGDAVVVALSREVGEGKGKGVSSRGVSRVPVCRRMGGDAVPLSSRGEGVLSSSHHRRARWVRARAKECSIRRGTGRVCCHRCVVPRVAFAFVGEWEGMPSSHGMSRVRVCRRTGRDGVSSQLSSQGEGGRTVIVASSHKVGEGEGAPSLSCRRTRWVRVRVRVTSGDRHALSFH